MTKMTVEQAVAAIHAADTEDVIQAAFEQCNKTQIHEVFLWVTSNKDELVSKSWKKEDLVSYYTARTMVFKASEAFKKMDAEAKAEHILDFDHVSYNSDLDKVLSSCSLYELLVIASKLGLSVKEIEARCKADWYDAASGLRTELRWFISRNAQNAKTLETEAAVEEASAVVEGQSEQPAVVAQCKAKEVATMTKWEKKQCAKARAKANRFFRTMDNHQIAFALGLYHKAMEWSETHDFSYLERTPTTRQKVEAWVNSPEAQEADGQYRGWLDYIDHYSRMLDVKIKGHHGFDEPTNADEEDSLVQSITDRVALIGADPRAVECEKAYHEELKAARQAAMKKIEGYIQAANGGLVEYTREFSSEIFETYRHNYEDEKAVHKAIAEYNCEVLSQYRTREDLIAAIMQANPMTIAQILYRLPGKQIDGRRALDARDANKFADWYMGSEYYHPEASAEQAQPEELDSYEIGKQIVSLKGKAKAQQALVEECGEEFLLNMHRVFSTAAPVRITMDTPDELRKYVCRDVIRVARDGEYARYLLKDAQARLDRRYDFDNRRYIEGWVKFLADYAAPEKELTVEERLAYLKQCIREECEARQFNRDLMRIVSESFVGMYKEAYDQHTKRGLELLRQYKELKRETSKPAVAVLEEPEVSSSIADAVPSLTSTEVELQNTRKVLQTKLHKLWQIRHAIRAAQKALNIRISDSDALGALWEDRMKYEAYSLLEEYKCARQVIQVSSKNEIETDVCGVTNLRVLSARKRKE